MPQFDVYRTADGETLLDCQADLLDDLNSRFVVPLMTPDKGGRPTRLNPMLTVAGEAWVMKTHFAATVSTRLLINHVGSAERERYTIIAALDMLISGF